MEEYPLNRELFGATKQSIMFGHPKPILYNITENDCWEVINLARNQDGYYKVQINNKTLLLHRLVYQQENHCFIKPEDVVQDINDDNPCCINPMHLEIGSNYDNIQDRNNRNRTAKEMKIMVEQN